jgi:hypothetical protein
MLVTDPVTAEDISLGYFSASFIRHPRAQLPLSAQITMKIPD